MYRISRVSARTPFFGTRFGDAPCCQDNPNPNLPNASVLIFAVPHRHHSADHGRWAESPGHPFLCFAPGTGRWKVPIVVDGGMNGSVSPSVILHVRRPSPGRPPMARRGRAAGAAPGRVLRSRPEYGGGWWCGVVGWGCRFPQPSPPSRLDLPPPLHRRVGVQSRRGPADRDRRRRRPDEDDDDDPEADDDAHRLTPVRPSLPPAADPPPRWRWLRCNDRLPLAPPLASKAFGIGSPPLLRCSIPKTSVLR